MAGKKYGLDDKYKALGVGERNISINPMQDDLEKLKGMAGAIGAPSKFVTRRMALSTGAGSDLAKRAGQSTVKKSFKEKIKEFATSKTNIGATAAGAGYELGKAQEKRYGGAMKKMRIGGAAVKGKGAVVGGSGLQDEKLKPGKNYKVKK